MLAASSIQAIISFFGDLVTFFTITFLFVWLLEEIREASPRTPKGTAFIHGRQAQQAQLGAYRCCQVKKPSKAQASCCCMFRVWFTKVSLHAV